MKVKLFKLVEDFDIYPRASVSSENVNKLVLAIEAGVKLPPIIADRLTFRIVDGFHRYEAYKSKFGDRLEIDVDFKKYPSEKDLFLDAVRRNAQQGLTLSLLDAETSKKKAKKLKIDEQLIADALSMTVERVHNFSITKTEIPFRNERAVITQSQLRDTASAVPEEKYPDITTVGYFVFTAQPDGKLRVDRVEKPKETCWNIIECNGLRKNSELYSSPVHVIIKTKPGELKADGEYQSEPIRVNKV